MIHQLIFDFLAYFHENILMFHLINQYNIDQLVHLDLIPIQNQNLYHQNVYFVPIEIVVESILVLLFDLKLMEFDQFEQLILLLLNEHNT